MCYNCNIKTKKKDEEKGSHFSEKPRVCIYLYISEPRKKTENSQLLCSIWTRRVLISQTNINTASFVISPHYTWGHKSFQDPPAFRLIQKNTVWRGPQGAGQVNGTDRRSSPSTYSEYTYVQVTGWCDSENIYIYIKETKLTRLDCAPFVRWKEQPFQMVDSGATIPRRKGLKLTLLQF